MFIHTEGRLGKLEKLFIEIWHAPLLITSFIGLTLQIKTCKKKFPENNCGFIENLTSL